MSMKAALKAVHRRALTCLNSNLGFALFLTVAACSFLVTLQVLGNALFFVGREAGLHTHDYEVPDSVVRNIQNGENMLHGAQPAILDMHGNRVNRTKLSVNDFSDNIGHIHAEQYLAYGPIDIVYTWVNGSDPVWLQKKEFWSDAVDGKLQPNTTVYNSTNGTNSRDLTTNTTILSEQDENNSNNRYRDSNELLYSLRSVQKNAPWIRKIYIVTDNQVPSWMNLENDRISIITHDQIFLNKSHLPVFSSPAIESHLHRIPGLSKKFIYFNDDVFLGTSVTPEDFVSVVGVQKFYLSWDVPKCAVGCADSWIGDGYCDTACNVSSCNFDYPDCINGSNVGRGGTTISHKAAPQCVQGCPDNWLADKVCDMRCKNAECGWDAGDCGIDKVVNEYPGIYLEPSQVKIIKANLHFGNFSVTNPLSDSVSHVHEKMDANSTNSSSTETDRDHLIHDVPVALEVEKGTHAVFFNTSLLPCQTVLDPSDCDTSAPVAGFQYTHAEFLEGSVVHVAVLLTKHQVLILVLFNGQENAPEPPSRYPYDSMITVCGFNSLTNISLNATFLLRTVETQAPHQVEATFPMNMDTVDGHFSICDKKLPKKVRFYEPQPLHFPVDKVKLIPRPLEIHSLSSTYQGVAVQSRIPSWSRISQPLLDLSLEQLQASVHISMVNASFRWELTLPFMELVGIINDVDLSTEKLSDTLPISEIALNSSFTVGGLLALLSSRQPVAAVAEGKDVKNFNIRGKKADPNLDLDMLDLVLLCPLPFRWEDVTTKSWVHSKIFVFVSSNVSDTGRVDQPLAWSRISQLDMLPESANNADNSTDTVSATNTSRFRAHTVVDDSKRSFSDKVFCLVGSFRWGGSTRGDAVRAAETAKQIQNATLGNYSLDVSDEINPLRNADSSSAENTTSGDSFDVNYNSWAGSPVRRLLLHRTATPERGRIFKGDDNNIIVATKILASSDFKLRKIHDDGSRPSSFQNPGSRDTASRGSRQSQKHTVRSSISFSAPSLFSTILNRWKTLGSSLIRGISIWRRRENRHMHGRRLEDTYAQSLINVNRMYNKAFGAEAVSRKVPAHMPHMIDRDYVQEMQNRWHNEWEETSTHRFRSSLDMQYSFSYYYYVMNRNKVIDLERDLLPFIIKEIDSNADGFVDENEFFTLLALTTASKSVNLVENNAIRDCVEASMNSASINKQKSRLFSASYFDDTNASITRTGVSSVPDGKDTETTISLHNSSEHSESVDYQMASGPVESVTVSFTVKRRPSVHEVARCPLVGLGLKTYFLDWALYKPSHTIGQENNVAFEMVGDNLTQTLSQLNSVRARRAKFICINDNMHNPSKELEIVLYQFFESFFPTPSQFELPAGVRNPTLYYDEYRRMRQDSPVPRDQSGYVRGSENDRKSYAVWFYGVCRRVSTGLTDLKYFLRSYRLWVYEFLATKLRMFADFLQPVDNGGEYLSSEQDDEEKLLSDLRVDVTRRSRLARVASSKHQLIHSKHQHRRLQGTVTLASKIMRKLAETDIFILICVVSFFCLLVYSRLSSKKSMIQKSSVASKAAISSMTSLNTKSNATLLDHPTGKSSQTRYFDIDGGARARRSITGPGDQLRQLRDVVGSNPNGKAWGWIRRARDGSVVSASASSSDRSSSSDGSGSDDDSGEESDGAVAEGNIPRRKTFFMKRSPYGYLKDTTDPRYTRTESFVENSSDTDGDVNAHSLLNAAQTKKSWGTPSNLLDRVWKNAGSGVSVIQGTINSVANVASSAASNAVSAAASAASLLSDSPVAEFQTFEASATGTNNYEGGSYCDEDEDDIGDYEDAGIAVFQPAFKGFPPPNWSTTGFKDPSKR
jgi:hypothetical protein